MFVERINSVGLKRELANSLGPTVAPLYWKTLKAFVKAKISKLELDLFLSSNLSQKNISLHNKFIRAILHNANPKVSPAPPQGKRSEGFSMEGGEKGSLIETEENIRKAKKRKAVLSLSKADRQQIRSLLQNKKPPAEIVPARFPEPNPQLIDQQDKTAELCSKTLHLPDADGIRQRVARKVFENGLKGYSEQSLELIAQSIDFYMKNILNNFILKTRSYQTSGNFHYCGISEEEFLSFHQATNPKKNSHQTKGLISANSSNSNINEDAKKLIEAHTISLPQMHFSLQLSPYLLGESGPFLDKMMNRLTQKNPLEQRIQS